VTNAAGASITGGSNGVYFGNGGTAGTLTNSGGISATGANSAGVDLAHGGVVTNNSTGSISGTGFGVFASGAAGTVANNGHITGPHGVALQAGGNVTNATGASITGQVSGVSSQAAAATVTNAGTVSAAAGGAGADIEGGGTVTNNAGATLAGGSFGVFITGGASTVVNAGTISGGSYAVEFAGSAANRLVVDPGAVFQGAVGGGNGTLELAAGSGALGGINNGSFLHFQSVVDDSGGNWTLNSTNSVANVTANGTLALAGSLDVSSAIDPSSTGTFQLGGGATLEVAAATGTQTQMSFLGSSALAIDNAAAFGVNVGSTSYAGPQLADFGAGDTIDLKNFAAAGVTLNYNAASGVLQVANGSSQVASLQFQTASLGSGIFHDSGDGGSGILITHS
jgi:hypothetical protein